MRSVWWKHLRTGIYRFPGHRHRDLCVIDRVPAPLMPLPHYRVRMKALCCLTYRRRSALYMSSVSIFTPVVVASWNEFSAVIGATATSMGYTVVTDVLDQVGSIIETA